MIKAQVALLKCEEYNVGVIEKKLREGFGYLGGEKFLRKLIPTGSRVLLKPNFLKVSQPGSIVITHYTIFEAVVRIVKEYTDDIIFGDSPGYGETKVSAERSGLMEVANKYGVKYVDFNETVHVALEDALLCKSWDVVKEAYEADVLITLPKLKTHAMTYFTGAVKNQFGCIPGQTKKMWHARMPEPENFAKMLLDLNKVVNTNFAIMDGIMAMEGNGPGNGTAHKMNTIIMGESITAVDSTAARLIGYDNPTDTPVLKVAQESGYGPVLPEEIEIIGETLESLKAEDFKLCRKPGIERAFESKRVARIARVIAAPNPTLINSKCIGCGRCREVCPVNPKVITMENKGNELRPKWDLKRCIRCFCCQELCPAGAIESKYTILSKILKMDKR